MKKDHSIESNHEFLASYFKKCHEELMCSLQPEEKEALGWFRRGLRAKNVDDKLHSYQKARKILGDLILR